MLDRGNLVNQLQLELSWHWRWQLARSCLLSKPRMLDSVRGQAAARNPSQSLPSTVERRRAGRRAMEMRRVEEVMAISKESL